MLNQKKKVILHASDEFDDYDLLNKVLVRMLVKVPDYSLAVAKVNPLRPMLLQWMDRRPGCILQIYHEEEYRVRNKKMVENGHALILLLEDGTEDTEIEHLLKCAKFKKLKTKTITYEGLSW